MRFGGFMRITAIAALVLAALFVSGLASGTGTWARAQSAASPHSGAAPSTTEAPKTAGERFKNIQVLKDIPADQIFPTMQFIAASLGVECDFCHVKGAFEKDDKEQKQTARKMITMMFAINKDHFGGERKVTCNT